MTLQHKIIAVVFIVTGLSLLAASGVLLAGKRRFLRDAASATGTVVRLARVAPPAKTNDRRLRSSERGTVFYAPVVRFTTPAGRAIEFQSGSGSIPPRYTVGAAVPIRYDPDDPGRAEIATFTNQWLLPVLLGGTGLTLTIVGTLLAFLLGRR
jgi:hypothetical protein